MLSLSKKILGSGTSFSLPPPPQKTVPFLPSHGSFSLPASSTPGVRELSAPPPCLSKLRLPGPPVCPVPDVTVRLQWPAGFRLPIGPSDHGLRNHQWQRRWAGGCPHPRWRPQELGAGDRRRGSGLGWPSDCGVLGASRRVPPWPAYKAFPGQSNGRREQQAVLEEERQAAGKVSPGRRKEEEIGPNPPDPKP